MTNPSAENLDRARRPADQRAAFVAALLRCSGNATRAAELVGVPVRSAQRWAALPATQALLAALRVGSSAAAEPAPEIEAQFTAAAAGAEAQVLAQEVGRLAGELAATWNTTAADVWAWVLAEFRPHVHKPSARIQALDRNCRVETVIAELGAPRRLQDPRRTQDVTDWAAVRERLAGAKKFTTRAAAIEHDAGSIQER